MNDMKVDPGLIILISVILVIGGIIGLASWSDHRDMQIVSEDKREIVRVFMHLPGDYSVLVLDGNELKSITFYAGHPRLVADVPNDKPMWYEAKMRRNGWTASAIIHIHAPKDVDGAGWQRGGKFRTSGTTTVVE